jgi:hypothetical protein
LVVLVKNNPTDSSSCAAAAIVPNKEKNKIENLGAIQNYVAIIIF